MVFSSIVFLFYFLPLFLACYFLFPGRNLTLLIASLAFYAIGERQYTLVLLFSIAANFCFGLGIAGAREPAVRRLWLGLAIAVNLVPLAYFKYADFLLSVLASAVPGLDAGWAQNVPLHLPIGISFFTFHALSYLIDVYRGDAEVERNPLDLALYISMFPQLVAGPIIRYRTIAGEIHHRRSNLDGWVAGIKFFIVGLGQKALIANTLASPVDAVFALPPSELSVGSAWMGAFGYMLQLYFDFAGYSNMAIGLALMLGMHFPQNFNYPYISRSITEFWRRWHMTLSAWFRDYLYIPLGGNRRGPWRTYLNLLIVFFLCGLWHGAAYMFIAWGLYHGLFLMLERAGLASLLQRLPRALQHGYALLVVLIGWVLFRAETFSEAAAVIGTMSGLREASPAAFAADYFFTPDACVAMAAGAVGSVPVIPAIGRWLGRRGEGVSNAAIAVSLAGVMLLAVSGIAAGTYNPFIYFRF
jgi:alginate O-acetyltransferase complex protein AlgI